MLEADFFPVELASPQSLPPDLLDVPLPALRPLPDEPPELPAEDAEKFSPAPAPLPLFSRAQIPASLPLEEGEADAEMRVAPPGPSPLNGADADTPAAPQSPELGTFVRPQLSPSITVPADVLSVPNPIADQLLAPPTGQELVASAPVRLARRYALQLRAAVSGVYDDGALIAITGNKPDFILALTPELVFTLGTSTSRAAVRLAYAPALTWYTQGTNKDGVNQNVRLDSRYKTGNLLLGMNAYAATSTSGGNLDTGQVSESQTYVSALTALYQLTAKTSVDFTLDDTVLKYSGFSSSNETRFQGFGNWQAGKYKLGLGGLVGHLSTQNEPAQDYLQPLGRLIYATGKLAFNFTAGYEFRDLGANQGSSSDPVFQVAAIYKLGTRTNFSVDAQRHVFASNENGGQNYINTSFNGAIQQGFTGYGRNVVLTLQGGLQNSYYAQVQGAGSAASPGGVDDYFYIRLGFDWAFRPRCQLGGFYEYSEDSSTRPGVVPFKRNRIGLQATFLFF